jgi:hypothetical protein
MKIKGKGKKREEGRNRRRISTSSLGGLRRGDFLSGKRRD